MNADANANADAGGNTTAFRELRSGELKRLKPSIFTATLPQEEYNRIKVIRQKLLN